MKVTAATVIDMLSRLRVYFRTTTDPRDYGDEEPFRSELYSSEQLNSHAIATAGAHRLQAARPADQLLKRLADNEQTLLEVRNLLVGNVKEGKAITPGGEWLLERQGELLRLRPCFPLGWPSILVIYRYGGSEYRITVFQVSGSQESRWTMDQQRGGGDAIRLINDGQPHIVEIHIGIEKKHINHTIHGKVNHL